MSGPRFRQIGCVGGQLMTGCVGDWLASRHAWTDHLKPGWWCKEIGQRLPNQPVPGAINPLCRGGGQAWGRGELQMLIFLGYQGALWGSASGQSCSWSHPVGGGGQVAGWAGTGLALWGETFYC
jgi:hypothetical protein